MSRLFAFIVMGLSTATARAGDSPPEKLLAPTTQVYVRWDGITPHQAAYKASVWGGVMKGPTGENLLAILKQVPKYLGSEMLSDPLLKGQPLEELRKVQADLKLVAKLQDLIADRGAMVAIEVRPPKPTLQGVVKAVGNLVKPKANQPPANDFLPDVRFFLIVPDAGDRAEALFAPTRLFNRAATSATEATPFPAELKVKGYRWPEVPGSSVQMGEWVMDGHFIEYVGSAAPEAVIAEMRANAATGGLTGNPLFQRAQKIEGFESVCRGFADTGAAIDLVKRFAGPMLPGLDRQLRDIGIGSLQAVVFSSGFDGRESRAVYEIDLPGDRKGFAKLLKRVPVGLKDLPPLPPDCSRFSALRVDWGGAYDGMIATAEALVPGSFGVEDGKKTTDQRIEARREFLTRELDKHAGISVTDDLLANLGDLFVMYQSPSEGLQAFGQCVALSCKDPEGVKIAMDRMQRAVDNVAGSRTKVRKKIYAGTEMREIHMRLFGVVTPSYAVVGNWLILGGNPQTVQGFILRHKGELDAWQPDAATAARIAKMPSDKVGLQYCNPKSTAHNLCCIAPIFVAAAGNFGNRNNNFDPPEVGLVPNAHELSRHLFPNLAATRDDGKTIRIEVNESFSLPLDFIGFDAFIISGAISLSRF